MDDRSTAVSPAADERFDRLAGASALAAAALSLIYALAFVVLKSDQIAAGALMAGGLFSAVALLGVYGWVRAAGRLAVVGLVFGLVGTMGAAIHGAYDLAVILGPTTDVPAIFPGPVAGPNPVDPRGFLTFGVAGLGVLLLSWAGSTVRGFPRLLVYLGAVLGLLLVVIYLGRLYILDANNPLVLGPAAITGVIVSPLWYAWMGWLLLKRRASSG